MTLQVKEIFGFDLDPNTSYKVMENPNQLIKFKLFRRSNIDDEKIDRRLVRAKNKNTLPIGSWAGWVHTHPYFQRFILLLIICNSILFAVEAGKQSISFLFLRT
jgi:proteasome lid subunit RPN8/RPN11